MRIFKRLSVYILIALTLACGNSAPTAPSPVYPQVAGTYLGPVPLTFPELDLIVTCSGSLTVTQHQNSLTFTPLVLSPNCEHMTIPLGPVTIDTNGTIIAGASGTFLETRCGGRYTYTLTGSFAVPEFRLSLNATSAECYNISVQTTLNR